MVWYLFSPQIVIHSISSTGWPRSSLLYTSVNAIRIFYDWSDRALYGCMGILHDHCLFIWNDNFSANKEAQVVYVYVISAALLRSRAVAICPTGMKRKNIGRNVEMDFSCVEYDILLYTWKISLYVTLGTIVQWFALYLIDDVSSIALWPPRSFSANSKPKGACTPSPRSQAVAICLRGIWKGKKKNIWSNAVSNSAFLG